MRLLYRGLYYPIYELKSRRVDWCFVLSKRRVEI